MNAKELHNLYAPLWAAVPETRPQLVRSVVTADGFELGDDDYADAPDKVVAYNAALCRVAAEDWLRNHCAVRLAPLVESDVSESVAIDCGVQRENEPDDAWIADFPGATIHHALVAACLAVHNASPSPAPPS